VQLQQTFRMQLDHISSTPLRWIGSYAPAVAGLADF
jgi:hypothetical protein